MPSGERDPDAAFFACAVVRDPGTGRVLLQLRDERAPVNPGLWGLFGGGCATTEAPQECLMREVHEELGVRLSAADVAPFREYLNPRNERRRHVFLVEGITESTPVSLQEGADLGWFSMGDALGLALTTGTRADLEFLRDEGAER